MSAYVLGIDTGGTYTDAVLLDATTRRVVAWNKERTTPHDLSLGVGRALTGLLAGGVRPSEVCRLSVSTTLATNAVVENRGAQVAPMSHKTLRNFFVAAPMIYAAIARLWADWGKPTVPERQG